MSLCVSGEKSSHGDTNITYPPLPNITDDRQRFKSQGLVSLC